MRKKTKKLTSAANKSASKTPKLRSKKLPQISRDLPVTQKMLVAVRNELKHDIQSVDMKVDSLDKKIQSVDMKVDTLRDEMNSKFEKVLGEIQRIGSIVEEQNHRNKVVYEAYEVIANRQDRIEKAFEEHVDQVMSVISLRKDPTA